MLDGNVGRIVVGYVLPDNRSDAIADTKYFVQWADGTNANIDLKQIGTGADLLLAPKTLANTGKPR